MKNFLPLVKTNRLRVICAAACVAAASSSLEAANATATEAASTFSPGSTDMNGLSAEHAVALAIADNPNLAAMQARFEAKSAIPSQVGVLPDPILSLNALNFPTDTFHVRQEAMTQVQIGISQKLPFPGKADEEDCLG